jgi:hypothetical protein
MSVKNLNYTISGLVPYENYNYVIEHLDANWPVNISPMSGSFAGPSDHLKVTSKITFCDSLNSSYCSGFMSYNTGSFHNGDDPYVDVRIKLTSNILDSDIYSDSIRVVCSGCSPTPIIVTNDNKVVTLNNENNTSIYFTINNLKPYTTYNYMLNDVHSNYPVLLTNIPKSGTFTTSSAKSYAIRSDLVFCHYENCSSPDFGATSVVNIEMQQCEKYFTNLNLSLNSDYLVADIISDNLTIECDNCLPKTTMSNPSLVTLNNSSSHKYSLITSFNGLKPYNKYEYSIVFKDSNHRVSFNNLSGYFYTKNDTSKNVETKLVFCENSGLCEYPYALGSIVDYDCAKNKYIEFNVKLDSDCLNNSIVGDVIRVDCDNCLPVVNIAVPSKATLTATSGNVRNFNVVASGLKPRSDYVYSFKNFDTNHLIGVKEVSGTINTKNATSVTIPNSLIFCESSGYCNRYVTTGVANDDVCNNLLSSSFRLELNSSCLPAPVISDKIEIDCDNCLPVVNIALPTSISTLTSTNLVSITGSVTNLKPFQSYSYYFTGDNNWPVVLDNVSGSFISKTASSSISTKLLFCYPSGSCDNEPGLLPYVPSSSAQKMLHNNNLYSKLKLNITPTHCSDIIYSSNILDINCKDCLPCVRYANVLFEGSPTITLDSGCCQGQKLLRVNVTNSVAGDRYTYKFDSANGVGVNSVVFNPTSGEIYFGSGGVGTINTICNVDLMDHAQTLLSCELTHDNTNSKIMDTVVLVCNNNNC